MLRRKHGWLAAALWLACAAAAAHPARAQQPQKGAFTGPITIKDLKVRFFFEQSARFSDDIAESGQTFINVPRGEGVAEPASGLLVILAVAGPKGGHSNDKIARHMAQVNVTRRYRAGPQLEQRVFGGFRFNDQGVAYKAFMIDAATCAPVEIDARLGHSRKTVTINFSCTPEGA